MSNRGTKHMAALPLLSKDVQEETQPSNQVKRITSRLDASPLFASFLLASAGFVLLTTHQDDRLARTSRQFGQSKSDLFSQLSSAIILGDANAMSPSSGADVSGNGNNVQILSVIHGIMIVVGLVACCFGYKLIRIAAFLVGFGIGGYVGIEIGNAMLSATAHNRNLIIGVIALIIGILVAVVIVFCIKVAIFLMGFSGGYALGNLFSYAFLYAIAPKHAEVVWIITVIIFGITLGILAVMFEKPLIITMTALCGAFFAIRSIGFFAGHYPEVQELREGLSTGETFKPSGAFWGYFAATVVLFGVGCFVQFKYTGTGDHGSMTNGGCACFKKKPGHNHNSDDEYYSRAVESRGKPVVNSHGQYTLVTS